MSFSITAPRCDVEDFKKEIESMTEQERERANQDMKGFMEPIDESPGLLIEKLLEVRLCIDQDQQNDKAAYYEAQRRIPDFVNSINFLLLFLRATRFDAEMAAKKIVKYWQYKLDLFGPEIAFRRGGRVKLSDFDDDDLATLDSFGILSLPKDKNGRGVLFSRRQNWMVSSLQSRRKNLARLLWYLLQDMTQDSQVQEKGIVLILYNFGVFSTKYHDRLVENLFGGIISEAFPCRIGGVHLCFDSKVHELALPFLLHSFGSRIRSRLRLHKSAPSLWEALEESGLRKEAFPMEFGGQLFIDINSWKKERETVEGTSPLLPRCSPSFGPSLFHSFFELRKDSERAH